MGRKEGGRQISSEVEDFKLSVTSLIPFFYLNLYISFFYFIFCCIFSFSLSTSEDVRFFIVFLLPPFPALFKSFKDKFSMKTREYGFKKEERINTNFYWGFL